MIVILLSLAFLCGMPLGFIIGVLVVWRMTKPPEDDEIDYSGGY